MTMGAVEKRRECWVQMYRGEEELSESLVSIRI